ncbi:MAG: RelA/SpoT domain-containing protein [Salinarimonas sp.]|nr:RelA/SpoT domain-containing protein [Salinarimonas sp.]
MSANEKKLREKWRSERHMYAAWGNFVINKVMEKIESLSLDVEPEIFIRIPPKCRVKEESSLLAKAFHRNKNYKNPYNDIEDKVGFRLVVLLLDDIKIVEEIITDSSLWNASKARDFEEEKTLKPFEFDYQSVHYIIRNSSEFLIDDVKIDAGIPCEIQIRTMLQHAYAELTHDTIYKPSVQAEPDVKRAAAKSMALIEATSDYFSTVKNTIQSAKGSEENINKSLKDIYNEIIKLSYEESPLNLMIIDYYKKYAPEKTYEKLREFLISKKPFLISRIRKRESLLYRQPAIILVYWAVSNYPNEPIDSSPISDKELAPIYSDLGRRLPGASV